jgi:hypothetical protein
MNSFKTRLGVPQTDAVQWDGLWFWERNALKSPNCRRTGVTSGDNTSPIGGRLLRRASMMQTFRCGASAASEIAVAEPPGPAPAITTSKSAKS